MKKKKKKKSLGLLEPEDGDKQRGFTRSGLIFPFSRKLQVRLREAVKGGNSCDPMQVDGGEWEGSRGVSDPTASSTVSFY